MHKIAPRTTCSRSTTAEALRSYSRIIYESKVTTYLNGFRLAAIAPKNNKKNALVKFTMVCERSENLK